MPLPRMWRFWYTALLEYPLLGAWIIRRTRVLRWLLRRGRPGLPDADVAAFADPAREPARARAGQQLHWQTVLRDIPRRVFGSYQHQHLSVPALLLVGERDFALSPRSLTGAGPHADHLAVRVINGAGHYLPRGMARHRRRRDPRDGQPMSSPRLPRRTDRRTRRIAGKARPWLTPALAVATESAARGGGGHATP
jgi:hypothetical protein